MKKIFVLVCLLALVAIMAVPMAASAATSGTGSTTIGGSIAQGSITIVAPGAIAFGTLSRVTTNEKTATPGRVTVVPGTNGSNTWSADAQGLTGDHPGYLVTGASENLTNPLLIGYNLAAPMFSAVLPLHYDTVAQPTGVLDFCAKQILAPPTADSIVGAYSCIITFTARLSVP